MRFHVLGVGNIGILLSHHIRQAHPKVPLSLITKANKRTGASRLHPEGLPGLEKPKLLVTRDGYTSRSTDFELEKVHNGEVERRVRRDNSPKLNAAEDDRWDGTPPNGRIESLIVCLKTYATISALVHLAPRISKSTVITLVQNGMGVYEELCAVVWPDPATRPQFILASTDHGAKPSPPNPDGTRDRFSIIHATVKGKGELKFGIVPDPRQEVDFEDWIWGSPVSALPVLSPPPQPPLPLRRLDPAHIENMRPLKETVELLLSLTELSANILPIPHMHHQLLAKLVINSVINPLTAVLGGGYLPNGVLFGSVPAHRLMKVLCEEASEIFTAYFRSISDPYPPPPDVLRLFSYETIYKRVLHVVRNTSENVSSMAYDASRGRMTEIKHITGYLINLGNKLGVPSKSHQMVYDMVMFNSEVSGLRKGVSDDVYKQANARRTFVRDQYDKAKESKTLEEIEMDEHRIDIVQNQALRGEKSRTKKKSKRRSKDKSLQNSGKDATPAISESVTDGNPPSVGSSEAESNSSENEFSSAEDMMSEKIDSATKDLTAEPSSASPEVISHASPSSSLEDRMSAMINAAPRESNPDPSTTTTSPIINIPSSTSSPSSTSPSPSSPPRSKFSLDDLISGAPRAERSWDVSGGKISGYTGMSPASSSSTVTPNLAKGGIKKSLDELIAGSPRQERTWDVVPGNSRPTMAKRRSRTS